jgi:hypothetical protein
MTDETMKATISILNLVFEMSSKTKKTALKLSMLLIDIG